MNTVRITSALLIAAGLLACRAPGHPRSDGASPPTPEVKSNSAAQPPTRPGPPDFDKIELPVGANIDHSRSLGWNAGEWREVVVFRLDGEEYCRAFTPEDQWADCDFVQEWDMIQWSSEQYLGLAVIAYTDPATPRLEHLRVLEYGCQLEMTCGEDPGTSNDGRFSSAMDAIHVDRFEISDVDGDNKPEIELVTSYVALASTTQEDLGEAPEDYAEAIFTRRRLTVLRADLSRQLDIDIHQETFETTPGMDADADYVNEAYQLTLEGVTISWCEIAVGAAIRLRECWPRVCASPTTLIRLPYDADKDLYGKATFEALRPVVEDGYECAN